MLINFSIVNVGHMAYGTDKRSKKSTAQHSDLVQKGMTFTFTRCCACAEDERPELETDRKDVDDYFNIRLNAASQWSLLCCPVPVNGPKVYKCIFTTWS